jgi:hypothetical protein
MPITIEDEEEPPECLEAEEKAAFYARLGVAWSLFLVFWTVMTKYCYSYLF